MIRGTNLKCQALQKCKQSPMLIQFLPKIDTS